MARTITPGRTWRDLPPSPPVGDLPPDEASPPPPEPPAPPEPRGRGWWTALALAIAAAVAVAAVWLLSDDGDASEVIGEAEPPPSVLEVPEADPFPGDIEEIIPEQLAPLIPPDLLDDLGPLFEGGDLPDLRQFFDQFGGEIPQFDFGEDFDLREFFEELPDFDLELPDFSFEFGDGRFGMGYLPEGYRVAGSSAGANSQGGDLEAEVTVRLVGPQGPVMIRAEIGGDPAAKLADAPGDPVEVRGGEGKLSPEGLSFAEGLAFVTISPQGDLPDAELFQIADGLGLGK